MEEKEHFRWKMWHVQRPWGMSQHGLIKVKKRRPIML